MTEPKTTGVWSHLRKRFPAVNTQTTLARQDNITSGFSTQYNGPIYTPTPYFLRTNFKYFKLWETQGKKQHRSTGSQKCCGQVNILKL